MQTWLLGACGLASPGPGTEITRPRKLRLRKRAVRGCGKGTGLRLRRAETHPALTRGRQTEKEAPTPGNSEALRPFAGCRATLHAFANPCGQMDISLLLNFHQLHFNNMLGLPGLSQNLIFKFLRESNWPIQPWPEKRERANRGGEEKKQTEDPKWALH
ncbi:uncharacterized protein LOC128773014 isoform X2 [Panthera pardus]|uniref:Uncharacterized protein LOC128773014 isoform X2 n=1 Tax=Panthera pardus TaxID=9691 RepID=A0A9W2UFV7_PANPR|nr:uncharacterized protein LOC128773014 isoform X2 [Panthera pardus]